MKTVKFNIGGKIITASAIGDAPRKFDIGGPPKINGMQNGLPTYGLKNPLLFTNLSSSNSLGLILTPKSTNVNTSTSKFMDANASMNAEQLKVDLKNLNLVNTIKNTFNLVGDLISKYGKPNISYTNNANNASPDGLSDTTANIDLGINSNGMDASSDIGIDGYGKKDGGRFDGGGSLNGTIGSAVLATGNIVTGLTDQFKRKPEINPLDKIGATGLDNIFHEPNMAYGGKINKFSGEDNSVKQDGLVPQTSAASGKEITQEEKERIEKELEKARIKEINSKVGAGVLAAGTVVTGMSDMLKNNNGSTYFDYLQGFNQMANGGLMNKFADAGAIGNAVGTAGSLLGNAIQQSQLDVDPGAVSKGLGSTSSNVGAKEFQANSNSYDELMSQMDNYKAMDHLNTMSAKDFNNDTLGSVFVNSLGAGLQGSGAGLQVGGGIGAIVGGVVGTTSSLFAAGAKLRKAVKAADKANHLINNINQLIDYENAYALRGFDNAFDNIATLLALNALLNFALEGGKFGNGGISTIGFRTKQNKVPLYSDMELTRFELVPLKNNLQGFNGTSYANGGTYEVNDRELQRLLSEGYIIERV